jgi:hypothetical protein
VTSVTAAQATALYIAFINRTASQNVGAVARVREHRPLRYARSNGLTDLKPYRRKIFDSVRLTIGGWLMLTISKSSFSNLPESTHVHSALALSIDASDEALTEANCLNKLFRKLQ